MTPQTLRRELRKTIRDILHRDASGENIPNSLCQEKIDSLSDTLTDAVLELRAFKQKPAFDKNQADPFWALFHGGSIDQEQIDAEKLQREAFASFENCLHMPSSWSWHSSGPDEKALKVLRDHVVKEYKKDKLIFQKYQTWRISPYARGAMSTLAIKRNPENFVYSWSDFLASYAMNEKNLPTVEVQSDENDAPITY